MKVLQITAHLGGGVGKILSSLAVKDANNKHIILCLEPMQNLKFYDILIENKVTVYRSLDEIKVDKLLASVDIVQVNWWHNPVVMEFMYNYLQDISTRLIVWSHNSGCNFPNIPVNFVKMVDKFIFSSQYSLDNPNWTNEERKYVTSNSVVVVSSGVELGYKLTKTSDKFTVGYLGHLDYNKTHPELVKFFESVDIGCDFLIAGDTSFATDLMQDVATSSVKDKVSFTGFATDVKLEFAKYDVFCSILNPLHTGTAENALLEAMSFGVVPIVLNQCSEKYTVTHMKNGIVVNNIDEFSKAIKFLYDNPTKLSELSKNAIQYINENLSIDATIRNINLVYEDVSKLEKSVHDVKSVFGITPKEWFLSCCTYDLDNLTGLVAGDTKSGIGQYKNYFGERFD